MRVITRKGGNKMFDIVEKELERFMEMLENDGFEDSKSNNFLDEDYFEDYVSKDDIYKQQKIFLEKAKKVLHEKYKDKYVIYFDFCIHIVNKEWFEQRRKRPD